MNSMEVILVNENDEEVGTMEKMEAHRKGVLHRAFSIFIFNEKGQMLIHQRAQKKYHNGGLWTNTCCSHPMPGEITAEAASRRLREEMGFDTELEKVFAFTYNEGFENGLTEYEFDHVFVGTWSGKIDPNPDEVQDYVYKNMAELDEELVSHPSKFTVWFRIAFPKIIAYRNQLLQSNNHS